MRQTCGIILAAALSSLLIVSAALAQPGYELRTFLVDPGDAAYTDESHQFGTSKLKGNYVCPICGYSTLLPAGAYTCPNPYGMPAGQHPNNTALEAVTSLRERSLSVAASTRAAGPPACDIRYRDTSTPVGAETYNDPNKFRSVIGRPHHPNRAGATGGPGSLVYSEFAWPSATANVTRARFVTYPPGTKLAQSCFTRTTQARFGDAPALLPLSVPWWESMASYAVGDYVRNMVGGVERYFRCTFAHIAIPILYEPGAGFFWNTAWTEIAERPIIVQLDSARVADGDTYYIRYMSRMANPLVPTEISGWRLWVYSRLYGLEFDSGRQAGTAPVGVQYLRILTASGSLRLTIPVLNDAVANGNAAVWEISFQTKSNGITNPGPERGPTAVGFGAPVLTEAGLNNVAWSTPGVFFQFGPTLVVQNTDPVVGNPSAPGPGTPYAIKAGETGAGRVQAHWQSGTDPWAAGPEPPVNIVDLVYGVNRNVRLYWYDDTEWFYDRFNRPLNADLITGANSFVMPAEPAESRFVASRFRVARTADTGHHGAVETPTGTYPRALMGTTDGTAPVVHAGATSGKAILTAHNHATQESSCYLCSLCGATFDTTQDRGSGYVHVLNPAWTVGTRYRPGDKVGILVPWYICIREHVAAAANAPPNANYWSAANADWYPEDKGYGVCPFHGDHSQPDAAHNTDVYGAPGPRVGLEKIDSTGSRVATDILRSLMAPEIGAQPSGARVPYIESFPYLRPHIPDRNVQLALNSSFLPPGTTSSAGSPLYAAVSVPKNQTSSEPGEAPGNSTGYEQNWGYRGTGLLYEQSDMRVTMYDPTVAVDDPYRWDLEAITTPFDDNGKWDAYFLCPDCGTPLPVWVSGIAYVVGNVAVNDQGRPFRCTSNHTSSRLTEPGIGPNTASCWAEIAPNTGPTFQCQNPDCPGHEFDRATGLKHPAGTTISPFTGFALGIVNPAPNGTGTNNFGFDSISAEEFDAFDLEVVVPKKTRLVAEATASDMGRTAPGIPTVPDLAVANDGLPAGRRGDPIGTSHYGTVRVRNDGNTVPLMLGIHPAATGVEDVWYRLARPEAESNDWGSDPSKSRGFGWVNAHNPVARSLASAFYEALGPAPLVGDAAAPWVAVMPPAGSEGSGNATGAVVMGVGTPIGTGQVLGRYAGPQVYFQDQDGDMLFDFDRPGVGAVTSARYVFDPERDVAYEPFMVADSLMRVSEARMPHNSNYANDTGPNAVFAYDGNGDPTALRVLWMSNTPDPSDTDAVPASDAPASVLAVTAQASGSGANRSYDWPAAAPTTFAPGVGPLGQTGPVDTYKIPNGMRYLWVSTDRTGGGTRSQINFLEETPTGNNTGVIWTGQQTPRGVRGCYDSDVGNAGTNPGHWTFWHTGARGQERIMYHVLLADGTEQAGELPIDNSLTPIDPQQTVDTMYDGDALGPSPAGPITIRKSPHGPFTGVKDISPVLYLPPVVYDTAGGGSATQPMIRVFFAGYARHLGNYDIYEARFNRTDLLLGDNNRGKLEFEHISSGLVPGIPEGLPAENPSEVLPGPPPGTGSVYAPGDPTGEEFTPDRLRQEFHSRHLDWVTASGLLNGGGGGVGFTLGTRTHHTTWHINYYDIQWGPADPRRGELYDEQRGIYRVIPRFCRHKEDSLFADPATWQWPNGPAAPQDGSLPNVRFRAGTGPNGENEYELIDPATYGLPDAEKRPLMMEIDPALGRVRFSSPLFNSLNATDQSSVFSLAFPALSTTIEDVFLTGQYSPFLWRHTLNPADDDCPTAILQSGAWHGNEEASSYSYPWPMDSHSNRMLLFWRRSFGSGQAPYYGRTAFLTKVESWTIRVNHPPISGNLVVRYPSDATDPQPELYGPGTPEEIVTPLPGYPGLPPGSYSGHRAEFDADLPNGEIAIWSGVFRWGTYPNGDRVRGYLSPGSTIRVQYDYEYLDDAGAVQTASADELHVIGGWSQETAIPIDSVLMEGPLRVVEETYRVPALPVTNPDMLVGRRYWVFWSSPRPMYDLRDVGDGGSRVRQSSDVFYCTVTPEFPSLVRDRLAASNSMDKYRPNLPIP